MMNRLTKATYVYWLLVMINFVSVMFNVSLYLLITSYISKKNLSLYLLQQLQVMPGNFRLLFWVVFVLFGCLVTVIYLRRTSTNKKTNKLLWLELLLIVLIFWLTKATYGGLVFLAFADIFFSTDDFHTISNKFYWLIFIIVASVCLLVSNSNFLATLISLPSLEIYISFLPSHVATLLSLMRLFLFIISIVIFTLALFTHVVYITNEKRNIEEELRMADHANVELQHYISVAEENTELRERKRISREIHDTLGHALTGISAGIDAVLVLIDMDKDSAKEQLRNLSEVVRQGIVDVRKSLNKMRPGALEKLSLYDSIVDMISRYDNIPTLTIDLDFQWQGVDLEKTTENVVFRIIEESITNSIRHGHAEKIWIRMTKDDKYYYIEIHDNGKGSPTIKPGFGLTQMQERLAIIGGTVTYQGDHGFTTKIKFIIKN